MTDFKKFKEQLPSKEKFYSLVAGKKISNKEYDHALKVWSKYEMKTMKGVFERFRNNSIKNYALFSSRYVSASGVSWKVILNMSNTK